VKIPFILHKNILTVIIAGILLTAMGFIASYAWMVQGNPLSTAVSVTFLFLILFGLSLALIPIMVGLIRYGNIEYMITNQRMIIKTGFMGHDTQFLDLDKIMDIYVHVGFIDKIFGTGTVCASNEASFFSRYPTYAFKLIDPFMRSTLWTIKAAVQKNVQLPLYAFNIEDPHTVQKILQEAIEKTQTISPPKNLPEERPKPPINDAGFK